MTARQLLYATLLLSGADAAYALADTFGTGATSAERTTSFIAKMNAKVDDLHLPHTEFSSVDGSGSDSSTPMELARPARCAMKNDTFRTVVKAKEYKKEYKGEAPAANGRTRYYTWTNTNQLLGSYDGAIAIKTGTTTPAGDCLVFAATRGGKTLVGAGPSAAARLRALRLDDAPVPSAAAGEAARQDQHRPFPAFASPPQSTNSASRCAPPVPIRQSTGPRLGTDPNPMPTCSRCRHQRRWQAGPRQPGGPAAAGRRRRGADRRSA